MADLCMCPITEIISPVCSTFNSVLKYTGTEFEDKLLSCGPAPDFDRSCWFDQKFKLGLDFPNLPYYIDGDIKVWISKMHLSTAIIFSISADPEQRYPEVCGPEVQQGAAGED